MMTSNYMFWGGFHAIASLSITIGIVLLVAWAIKNLKKNTLMKTGVGLVIIGLIACLISAATGGWYGKKHMKWNKDYMDKEWKAGKMMEIEGDEMMDGEMIELDFDNMMEEKSNE